MENKDKMTMEQKFAWLVDAIMCILHDSGRYPSLQFGEFFWPPAKVTDSNDPNDVPVFRFAICVEAYFCIKVSMDAAGFKFAWAHKVYPNDPESLTLECFYSGSIVAPHDEMFGFAYAVAEQFRGEHTPAGYFILPDLDDATTWSDYGLIEIDLATLVLDCEGEES